MFFGKNHWTFCLVMVVIGISLLASIEGRKIEESNTKPDKNGETPLTNATKRVKAKRTHLPEGVKKHSTPPRDPSTTSADIVSTSGGSTTLPSREQFGNVFDVMSAENFSPPSQGSTTPSSGGSTTPPSGSITTFPSGGNITLPTGGITTPPAGGITTPPSGGSITLSSGGITTPPPGGITTPPSGGNITTASTGGNTTAPTENNPPH